MALHGFSNLTGFDTGASSAALQRTILKNHGDLCCDKPGGDVGMQPDLQSEDGAYVEQAMTGCDIEAYIAVHSSIGCSALGRPSTTHCEHLGDHVVI